MGVRGEVIEQEGKQETVSQRQGSHTALAMNRRERTRMGISDSVLQSGNTVGHECIWPFSYYKLC